MLDNLGQRLVDAGQSLMRRRGVVASPEDGDQAPSAVEPRRVGEFVVRAWRSGDRLELDAVLDGQVVVHERRVARGEAEVRGAVERFDAQLMGTETRWRDELRARADGLIAAADQVSRDFFAAAKDIESARRRRDEAERELPRAVWRAERAKEWQQRTSGKGRELDAVHLRGLEPAGLSPAQIQGSCFSVEWLAAARAQWSAPGQWVDFRGSSGPGRADLDAVVVVRQPADALLHFKAHGDGRDVHYVCVGGPQPAATDSALTAVQAASVAWELRALAEGAGGAAGPRVYAAVGAAGRRFADEVLALAAAAGLGGEEWLVPGLTVAAAEPKAPQVAAPPPGRSPDEEQRGAAPMKPAAPVAAPPASDADGREIFRVAGRLFHLGIPARVIKSPAFGDAFVRLAAEELRSGKMGPPRVGPRSAKVKSVVFVDRGADALAYHLISGEQMGTVYVVTGEAQLAEVVGRDDLKPLLSMRDVRLVAAFEAGKAGLDRVEELRQALGARSVERREPTHGRYWLTTVEAREKNKARGR